MPRLLIVEDNELNRDMLSRRLQRRGYEVLLAVDGGQGLAVARAERPDLILMDMSLPVVDGWEAVRRLKADPVTRPIPVIALTAHAMAGDEARARSAGCDDFDTKPVDLARLLGKIGKWLGEVPLKIPDTGNFVPAFRPPPAAELTVTATRESLAPLLEFTERASREMGSDSDTTFRVRLAVEEVCLNIINYAYQGREPGPIRLRILREPAAVQVIVEDRGVPFDPAELAAPDLSAPAEARAVGGLGWHLVKQVMDEVHHDSPVEGGNRITLIRRLVAASDGAHGE